MPAVPDPPTPEMPASLMERIEALEAYVVSNEQRISVLEATTSQAQVEDHDTLAKLKWAVAHGRKRPW
jgi:hypothetical protein